MLRIITKLVKLCETKKTTGEMVPGDCKSNRKIFKVEVKKESENDSESNFRVVPTKNSCEISMEHAHSRPLTWVQPQFAFTLHFLRSNPGSTHLQSRVGLIQVQPRLAAFTLFSLKVNLG